MYTNRFRWTKACILAIVTPVEVPYFGWHKYQRYIVAKYYDYGHLLYVLFLACGPKTASHIDTNSHSVLGLHLFMFRYIILAFDCNAQRTCLILSVLIHTRLNSSSKNKRWKISALAHRLKITHGNFYFILTFLHIRTRDRNS